MRLEGKIAIIVGAGQTAGDTIGNGRATALLFAREGAQVIAADRRLESAQETVKMIAAEGGNATAIEVDATIESDCEALIRSTVDRHQRIDILHNNVGIGGGDSGPAHLDEDTWDRILAVNLKSVILPCKHVLPVMRSQAGGSIVNISSIAAICSTPIVAYKVSKAGVNAYTQSLAVGNAKYGIRANVIMPGLMNTPMAVESRVGLDGKTREEVIAERDSRVPLGRKMGSAWDVANAALFLASDDASFITGVALAVDGGSSLRMG